MPYTDAQLVGVQVAKFLTTGQGNNLLKPETEPWTSAPGTITLNELHQKLLDVQAAQASADTDAAGHHDALLAALEAAETAAQERHDALMAKLDELHPAAPEEPPAEDPGA